MSIQQGFPSPTNYDALRRNWAAGPEWMGLDNYRTVNGERQQLFLRREKRRSMPLHPFENVYEWRKVQEP